MGVGSLLLPWIWGIKHSSSGLYSKCFYTLSHSLPSEGQVQSLYLLRPQTLFPIKAFEVVGGPIRMERGSCLDLEVF